MKEMLVKIPDESTEFVTELLQKLGVHLEDTSNKKIKKNKIPFRLPIFLESGKIWT